MWPDVSLCWGTLRQASLCELMAAASANGFRAITVSPLLYEEALISATPDQLRQQLDRLGLTVSALEALTGCLPGAPAIEIVDPAFRRAHGVSFSQGLDVADALGIPVICVSSFLGRTVPLDDMAIGVRAFARLAAARGRKIALEFIPSTGIPDLPTAGAIVQRCGESNVGLVLDVWHFCRSGGEVKNIVALPANALLSVQLCDRNAAADIGTYVPMSNRLLPGEGDAPVAEILQAAIHNSPEATVGVEVFSQSLATMTPHEAARHTADALARFQNKLSIK